MIKVSVVKHLQTTLYGNVVVPKNGNDVTFHVCRSPVTWSDVAHLLWDEFTLT